MKVELGDSYFYIEGRSIQHSCYHHMPIDQIRLRDGNLYLTLKDAITSLSTSKTVGDTRVLSKMVENVGNGLPMHEGVIGLDQRTLYVLSKCTLQGVTHPLNIPYPYYYISDSGHIESAINTCSPADEYRFLNNNAYSSRREAINAVTDYIGCQHGDTYYYVSDAGVISSAVYEGSVRDLYRITIGNAHYSVSDLKASAIVRGGL